MTRCSRSSFQNYVFFVISIYPLLFIFKHFEITISHPTLRFVILTSTTVSAPLFSVR